MLPLTACWSVRFLFSLPSCCDRTQLCHFAPSSCFISGSAPLYLVRLCLQVSVLLHVSFAVDLFCPSKQAKQCRSWLTRTRTCSENVKQKQGAQYNAKILYNRTKAKANRARTATTTNAHTSSSHAGGAKSDTIQERNRVEVAIDHVNANANAINRVATAVGREADSQADTPVASPAESERQSHRSDAQRCVLFDFCVFPGVLMCFRVKMAALVAFWLFCVSTPVSFAFCGAAMSIRFVDCLLFVFAFCERVCCFTCCVAWI